MEQYDDMLKRMAREEDTPLPSWASACIDDALANLPQKRRRHGKVLRYFGTAMAACWPFSSPCPISAPRPPTPSRHCRWWGRW